jgi:hypothetical protein
MKVVLPFGSDKDKDELPNEDLRTTRCVAVRGHVRRKAASARD